MGFVQITLVLLIAAVLLLGGTRGFLWGHLRSRRLGRVSIRMVQPAELPSTLAPVLEAAARDLRALGFEEAGARWTGSIDRFEGDRPELVFVHPGTGALALAGPPIPGMGDRPYRVSFFSKVDGGPVVATFDGIAHLTPRFPGGWECRDHDVNDLGRQWAHHLHALEAHGGRSGTVRVDPAAWNRIEQEAISSTLDEWERDGAIGRIPSTSDADPSWRLRPMEAWALAGSMLAGQKRVLAREAEAARDQARRELWRENLDILTDPMDPHLERARAAGMAWSYRYHRDANRRRQDSRTTAARWAAGLVSAGGCVAVFAIWFGWELALLLTGVLLLHELGHVAGMAALGYRDRRILFLPFFGAAARGEKADATPAQRTVVALLGPVPGLLVGLGCLHVFFQAGGLWWMALATTALIVNYFNLLPISSLDGGRVLEVLLLGRYPRAQVVFLAGGTIALAAVGWWFRDPILAAMSLALIISLRSAWSAARGVVRVRERVDPGMSRAERTQVVFETLQEPPFASTPPVQRIRLASIIEPRVAIQPVRPRAALAGALVYLGLLAGTPAAVTASVYLFQPALWELVITRGEGEGEGSSNVAAAAAAAAPLAAGQPDQPSSVSIFEASFVGR
ncbi:MAG: site-2 protease family protein [Gemmatimonadota bacterium]|nr:site-2 protease family protein [Gemmatimonadota bacterium]